MRTFLIAGKARCGKDTTAQYLKERFEHWGKKVVVMHFADLLKFYCREYFGWDGNKDEKGRSLLQHIGTDVVRARNVNYWVDHVNGFLKMFENEIDFVIVADCRFPNELDGIDERFNPVKIQVLRPGFESNLTKEQKNHPSETALDDYKNFDITIENPGDETYIEVIKDALMDLYL